MSAAESAVADTLREHRDRLDRHEEQLGDQGARLTIVETDMAIVKSQTLDARDYARDAKEAALAGLAKLDEPGWFPRLMESIGNAITENTIIGVSRTVGVVVIALAVIGLFWAGRVGKTSGKIDGSGASWELSAGASKANEVDDDGGADAGGMDTAVDATPAD